MPSSTHIAQAPAAETLSPAERVTRQIEAALARGVRPWVKPWTEGASAPPLVLPLRACGRAYRGMNTVALWAARAEGGFASPFWLTFKQALAEGGAVRKGERGSFVIFYKDLRRQGAGSDGGAPDDAADGADRDRPRFVLRGYTVFNADQCDGLSDRFRPASAPCPTDADGARFAALFARVPATIRYGGNRAFYAPSADFVQLPAKAAFPDPTRFYATLAHELGHWTRHPSRLDRDFGQTRFGDPAYALEELVAELCAAFVGAAVGLPADHIEDHAGYIAGWLKALQANPSAFLTAAATAQAAADYLLDLMGLSPASLAQIPGAPAPGP